MYPIVLTLENSIYCVREMHAVGWRFPKGCLRLLGEYSYFIFLSKQMSIIRAGNAASNLKLPAVRSAFVRWRPIPKQRAEIGRR